MGDVQHNCSISVTHSLPDAYDFLKAQDHRGPDAAGIGALRRNGLIDIVTWMGPITRFDVEGLEELFPHDDYTFFFGHGRYATRGSETSVIDEAHPIALGGERYDRNADHRIIRGAHAAIIHNGQVPDLGYDQQTLKTRVDSEQLLRYYHEHGPEKTMRDVSVAYTAVFIDSKHGGVVVMRDRTGIKPGVVGEKNRKTVIASEDIAIRKNHARVVENLAPGAIYFLRDDGTRKKKTVFEETPKRCFFEWMYISHLDTVLDDRSVRSVREHVGRVLAEEIAPPADIVTFLPRSPETAARSYADERGLEFETVFYKVNKQRSFLEPNQKAREDSIQKNLYIRPEMGEVIKGKRLIIIDDSIVRGTNSRYVSRLLERAGAKSVHLLSCTPPIGVFGADGEPRGCEWGVDMPPDSTFIARDAAKGRNRSEKEISDLVGMNVRYLSIPGLMRAYKRAGIDPGSLCTFCIGGERPDR